MDPPWALGVGSYDVVRTGLDGSAAARPAALVHAGASRGDNTLSASIISKILVPYSEYSSYHIPHIPQDAIGRY